MSAPGYVALHLLGCCLTQHLQGAAQAADRCGTTPDNQQQLLLACQLSRSSLHRCSRPVPA